MTEAEVTRLNTTLRASAPSPPLRARKPLLRYGIVVNGRQRSIVNELGNARVDLCNLSFLFCKRVSRKITKIRDHKIGNVFPKLAIRETLQTSENLCGNRRSRNDIALEDALEESNRRSIVGVDQGEGHECREDHGFNP